MIHITQCLCPNRHCIVGFAWPESEMTSETAIEALRIMVEGEIKAGRLNAWCGLCGDHRFHYEDGITRFETMAEALPYLRRTEEENAVTRRVLRRY